MNIIIFIGCKEIIKLFVTKKACSKKLGNLVLDYKEMLESLVKMKVLSIQRLKKEPYFWLQK